MCFFIWTNLSVQPLLFFSGRKRCYPRKDSPLERNTLQTILSNYETCNIYSADEFGFYYQTLPQKTLNLKKEKYAGRKFSKICLTGLAAVSENATSKE